MKAIVGVDPLETYRHALRLLLRLRPEPLGLRFVHAVEPLHTFLPADPSSQVPYRAMLQEARKAGEAALGALKSEFEGQGLTCETALVDGFPSHMLIAEADRERAEWIAVGGGQKGALENLFLGSVSRGVLTGASQSVLVGKGETAGEGPVHAVFATDHSEYADACVQKLLNWKLEGLGRVRVVTALPRGMSEPETRSAVERKTVQVATQFREAGVEAEVSVQEGAPSQVLPEAMRSSGAELMILGAQGHGFLERLLIGSTSLQQVASAPYSVLVVRR